jgi:Xaa-Pro dipeptidase
MRCASVACENAVHEMERVARKIIPKGNMRENDVWTVLHAEKIRRGGEGI